MEYIASCCCFCYQPPLCLLNTAQTAKVNDWIARWNKEKNLEWKEEIEDATQVKLTLKPTELFSLKKIQFVLEREFEIKNLKRRNRTGKRCTVQVIW